ncbi:DUF1627 domain-containing protein [Salmonella enterica]|nr:DUF1627 domain-containing protein [Salmonella enterica]EGL7479701.1 DUF1627 domain-containing protein [Salmonella enterica]EIZ2335027.1 DUF1627 domain-containing protein [Salmonella enterica]
METVFDALKAMGVASAIELSARTRIHKDQVVNELWDMKREGRVERHGRSWRVVEVDTDKIPEAEMAEKAQTESVAEVVQSIPSFTEKRPDGLMIPAPRFISAEIRRTAAKLKRLQALREVAREVHKPRNRKLWQQIRGE